jgi:hypothetical protein
MSTTTTAAALMMTWVSVAEFPSWYDGARWQSPVPATPGTPVIVPSNTCPYQEPNQRRAGGVACRIVGWAPAREFASPSRRRSTATNGAKQPDQRRHPVMAR